jgi:hypothetical protein
MSGRSLVYRLSAAVGLTLLLTAVTVQAAHAGTYVMRNCSVPGYDVAPLGPWQPQEAPGMAVSDACPSGGGVGFVFSGEQSVWPTTSAVVALKRPTAGPRSAIKLSRVELWYASRLAGSGAPLHLGYWLTYSEDMATYSSESLPNPIDVTLNSDTVGYFFGIRCPGGASGNEYCYPSHPMPFQALGMRTTLTEDVRPSGAILGGSLLESGPQSGTRTLTIAAADSESGLAKLEALLGDTIVASRDLARDCTYADLTVCPTADDATMVADTRTVPDGAHRLTLRVRDAAGNERLIEAPSVVRVTNGGPLISAANRLRLSSSFVGSSRSTLTVPFGQKVTVKGRLSGTSGGIGNASIDVYERLTRAGARDRTLGRVSTRADGTFSYAIASGKPSRTLRLVFDPGGTAKRVSRVLRLQVRAESTFRATLQGTTVRFSGRVLSGPIPKIGKRVFLQGTASGYGWVYLASIRTNRSGNFSGRYPLSVRRRAGVRVQFRVVVPTGRSYPYVSHTGRPVSLRVP